MKIMQRKSSNNSESQNDRRRFVRIAFTLGGASSMFFCKEIFGFNFMFSGYSRDFKFTFSYPGVWTHGHSLIRSKDGGYLISFDGGETSNLLKLDSKGKQQWVKAQWGSDKGSKFTGKGICEATDSSYLLAGTTNSHDLVGRSWDAAESKRTTLRYGETPVMALLSKINGKGELVWKKIYGTAGGFFKNSAVYAMPTRDGGAVVFGTKTVSLEPDLFLRKTHEIECPWIIKIDNNGEIKGESLLKEHKGGMIMSPFASTYQLYSKPIADSGGNLFTCSRLEKIQVVVDQNGQKKLDPASPQNQELYLLLKLDSNGKETARYELEEDTVGLPAMVLSKDGIELFRKNDSPDKRIGFVHFKLDINLKLISRKLIEDEKFWPKCVIRNSENGFHMFGSNIEPGETRGEAALVYLDKNGKLQHQHSFGRDSQPNDMTAGDNENEIIVFYDTSKDDVIKIEKFILNS